MSHQNLQIQIRETKSWAGVCFMFWVSSLTATHNSFIVGLFYWTFSFLVAAVGCFRIDLLMKIKIQYEKCLKCSKQIYSPINSRINIIFLIMGYIEIYRKNLNLCGLSLFLRRVICVVWPLACPSDNCLLHKFAQWLFKIFWLSRTSGQVLILNPDCIHSQQNLEWLT